MIRDEVVDLLSIIAVTDHRTVGGTDIDLWEKLIGHLAVDDCTDAVLAHCREQPGVWLQPGHIIARVRAARADDLARMDPDERGAALAAQQKARRDRYGYIDKSEPDTGDWPAEWTPDQRNAASWQRIQEYRDLREYEQAIRHPRSLSTARPASPQARSRAIQSVAHQYSLEDVGADLPHVNPHAVRCDFCQSAAGESCTLAGGPGRPREKCRAHPLRVQAAALAAGLDAAQVTAAVTAWCRGSIAVQSQRVEA